jgi:hypothetical protein
MRAPKQTTAMLLQGDFCKRGFGLLNHFGSPARRQFNNRSRFVLPISRVLAFHVVCMCEVLSVTFFGCLFLLPIYQLRLERIMRTRRISQFTHELSGEQVAAFGYTPKHTTPRDGEEHGNKARRGEIGKGIHDTNEGRNLPKLSLSTAFVASKLTAINQWTAFP